MRNNPGWPGSKSKLMKKIFRRLAIVLLTLVIGLGAAGLWLYRSLRPSLSAYTSSVESETSDEYAVYSALIRESYLEDGVKMLVIQNRTLFYGNPDYLKITTAEQRVQDMRRYCQSVDESALRDFQSKHLQSSEVTANFDLPVRYLLVNKDDFDESSDEKARLVIAEFYQRYPDARGMIALSRVGFNQTRDQAFLRVEFTFCPLCSHGGKVLLKKEWGKWKVVDSFGGWAS